MTSALKNRLIGTVIIVAVAVIFLPDLLNGKTQSEKELFVELPKRPAVKTVQRPGGFSSEEVVGLATRDIEIVDDKAIDDQDQNTSTNEVSEVSAAVPDTTEQSVAQAPSTIESDTQVEDSQALLEGAGWVVQLGTFRHKKNVQELLTKLEKGGYRAFSRPVQTSSGTLTKVFVGPDLQKDRLEKSLNNLTELTRLKGRVTPFTIQ